MRDMNAATPSLTAPHAAFACPYAVRCLAAGGSLDPLAIFEVA